MVNIKLLIVIFISFLVSSCLTSSQQFVKKAGGKKGVFVKITTEKGVAVAQLEYKKVPLTVANFIILTKGIIPNDTLKSGIPFYNGLSFYKVFKDYMLMTGCPKNNGTGNPGYLFYEEFNSTLTHDKPGVLSMVGNGPFSIGSQFVITLRDSKVLDNKYPVFGQIISGMEILKTIQQGDKMETLEIITLGRKAQSFDPQALFKKNGFEHMLKPKL